MTSTARWKLCSAVLLAATAYSWTHRAPAPSAATAAPAPASRAERIRPVRVAPAARGASTDELVERLYAARRVEEVCAIAAQLGAIGDDTTIDAITPLLRDRREGVPDAILRAIGTIGTDHAVRVLTPYTREDFAQSDIATEALGLTHNPAAEDLLGELALGTYDLRRDAAVVALGEIGTDGAVEVLLSVANGSQDTDADAAVEAIGRIATPHATAALVGLIDGPSLRLADDALEAITDVDDALVAKLSEVIRSGPEELRDTAVSTLARAGAAGFPALRELALRGPASVRERAIVALAETRQPEAFATLHDLLATEPDTWMLAQVTEALASLDTPGARALLIDTARSGGRGSTAAVETLVSLDGPEVDDALRSLASDPDLGPTIMSALLARGDAQAVAMTLARARAASEDQRYEVMLELARSNSDAATEALTVLVRELRGPSRLSGLSLLASARPPDPALIELYRDLVRHGTTEEAEVAISVLGDSVSTAARDALIDALARPDDGIVLSAAEALEEFRMTDATAAALSAAAVSHPELGASVTSHLVVAGSPEGIRLVEAALAGDDPSAMEDALAALGNARTDASRDLLERSTRSADPQVRGFAIEVLATTADPRAEDTAVSAIGDPELSVRSSAAEALGSMRTDRARDALIRMLDDPAPEIRITAADWLVGRRDLDAATRAQIEAIRAPDEVEDLVEAPWTSPP